MLFFFNLYYSIPNQKNSKLKVEEESEVAVGLGKEMTAYLVCQIKNIAATQANNIPPKCCHKNPVDSCEYFL